MLTKNEVRLSIGMPAVELFASATGTPIVIDVTTGQAYFLDSTGSVAPFKLSVDDLLGILAQVHGGWGEDSTSIWDIATQTLTAAAANLDFLVFPKEAGKGIKVDQNTPTFGWRDLPGRISVRGLGGTDPTFAVYRTNIRQFQYSVGDESWVEFHIPHDYVPGSDCFLHAHWSVITNVVETVTWGFDVSYAKGHGQATFPAPVNVTVAQASNGTAFTHFIAEVQISGASLVPAGSIEPDGLMLVRVYLSANTGVIEPFLHSAGLYYQSTSIGTKQKAPDFYV